MLKENVDFYYTASGKMVFTEHFLRRRGFCCQSSCRHCPYGFTQKQIKKSELVPLELQLNDTGETELKNKLAAYEDFEGIEDYLKED